uniref:DNA-directed RNA polymerase n=1 Tax=Angiostrongylus cantonensis TaxID=6313 RepID=A0A158P8E6_ANGCA
MEAAWITKNYGDDLYLQRTYSCIRALDRGLAHASKNDKYRRAVDHYVLKNSVLFDPVDFDVIDPEGQHIIRGMSVYEMQEIGNIITIQSNTDDTLRVIHGALKDNMCFEQHSIANEERVQQGVLDGTYLP